MSKQRNFKPLAIAAGAALTAGVAAMPAANADENPFGMQGHSSGYTVANHHEGKCGEGKCGEGNMKDMGKKEMEKMKDKGAGKMEGMKDRGKKKMEKMGDDM